MSFLGNASAPRLSLFQIAAAKAPPDVFLKPERPSSSFASTFSTCHLISSSLHGKLQTRVLPYSLTVPQAVFPFTLASSLFKNPALFFHLFIHSNWSGTPFRTGCEGGIVFLRTFFFNLTIRSFLDPKSLSSSSSPPYHIGRLVTFFASVGYIFFCICMLSAFSSSRLPCIHPARPALARCTSLLTACTTSFSGLIQSANAVYHGTLLRAIFFSGRG